MRHSVPAGYFADQLLLTACRTYPQPMVGLKEPFAYAVLNVIVTAIGGENSEQGAARFAAEVLCHRPDVVTIDYALNDRQLGLERPEAAWRKMISAALPLKAQPYQLPMPTHDVLSQHRNEPM